VQETAAVSSTTSPAWQPPPWQPPPEAAAVIAATDQQRLGREIENNPLGKLAELETALQQVAGIRTQLDQIKTNLNQLQQASATNPGAATELRQSDFTELNRDIAALDAAIKQSAALTNSGGANLHETDDISGEIAELESLLQSAETQFAKLKAVKVNDNFNW